MKSGDRLWCSKLFIGNYVFTGNYYLCDFVKDIKIDVYLELPRKISFNLVSDFLSK